MKQEIKTIAEAFKLYKIGDVVVLGERGYQTLGMILKELGVDVRYSPYIGDGEGFIVRNPELQKIEDIRELTRLYKERCLDGN